MKHPRCHDCGHPGRHRRVVAGNKKPCDCACHRPPSALPVREHHGWPGWVDADVEFEEAV